jgi:hypothetical protein
MIHEGHEGSRRVKRKFVAFVFFVDFGKAQLRPVCSIRLWRRTKTDLKLKFGPLPTRFELPGRFVR